MRLIDADANIETMKKCAENPEDKYALLCYRYAQMVLEEAPTVEPVPPWHRVEEPPNFSGKVLVWRDVLGDFGDREYTFDTAYYNGLDGGRIPKGTFFQPIPGKMGFKALDDVTHWARPEPPKEDEHGN